MTPAAVSTVTPSTGSPRGPGARSSEREQAGAFPDLLAGAETAAEPARSREPEGPADTEAQQAEPTAAPVTDASLLAALGLAPLPLEPAAGSGWNTLARTGETGLWGAPTALGTGTGGQRAANLAPHGALDGGAAAAADASALPVSRDAPGRAGSARASASANAALAAMAVATADDVQSAPLAKASATASAPLAAGPLQAGPAQGTGAAALAVAQLSKTAGTAAAGMPGDARAAETLQVDLKLATLPASPRPAALFNLASLAGQVPSGSAAPVALALDATPAGEAIALALGVEGTESAPGPRRIVGETGYLLPTAPFGLERAELTISPRENLLSLPPLITGARLDPTTPQFSVALGQQMQWMASQQVGRAELRLDPEELGPLEIRLEMNGDEIRAEFSSRSAEVRSLLETQVPRLRELLAEQGFSLADAQVGQERAAYQDAPQQREAFAARGDRADAPQVDAVEAPPAAPVRIRQGLVDDFA